MAARRFFWLAGTDILRWSNNSPENRLFLSSGGGNFTEVPVGAGPHTVRFEFDPEDLRTGRMISSILALVLIGYGIGLVVVRRRRRDEETGAA